MGEFSVGESSGHARRYPHLVVLPPLVGVVYILEVAHAGVEVGLFDVAFGVLGGVDQELRARRTQVVVKLPCEQIQIKVNTI